jgi:hypothetical protein
MYFGNYNGRFEELMAGVPSSSIPDLGFEGCNVSARVLFEISQISIDENEMNS